MNSAVFTNPALVTLLVAGGGFVTNLVVLAAVLYVQNQLLKLEKRLVHKGECRDRHADLVTRLKQLEARIAQ